MQEQLQQLEKKAKQNDEKFLKMKEVYTKLREEHIGLLRAKAELEKKVHQQSSEAAQHSEVGSSIFTRDFFLLESRPGSKLALDLILRDFPVEHSQLYLRFTHYTQLAQNIK